MDLKAQYLSIKNEIDAAVNDVINESAFIKGKYVQKFEEEYSETYGVKHVISCANGTDAIYISLKALGIGQGDEVITVANTWISTSETITQTGAKPIFVDINSDNYSINLEEIKKSINNKTKAIIVPYLYGDTFSISELKELNIPIIEDVCHCTGCSVNKKQVGSLGEIGITSFGEKKFLDGGFGGAVFTNNADFFLYFRNLFKIF